MAPKNDHLVVDPELNPYIYLEVGREGVGQTHAAREGGQDQVPHLDTVRWDHVTEPKSSKLSEYFNLFTFWLRTFKCGSEPVMIPNQA